MSSRCHARNRSSTGLIQDDVLQQRPSKNFTRPYALAIPASAAELLPDEPSLPRCNRDIPSRCLQASPDRLPRFLPARPPDGASEELPVAPHRIPETGDPGRAHITLDSLLYIPRYVNKQISTASRRGPLQEAVYQHNQLKLYSARYCCKHLNSNALALTTSTR
jgi:hypothetical protein